jgi:hypothetical protein
LTEAIARRDVETLPVMSSAGNRLAQMRVSNMSDMRPAATPAAGETPDEAAVKTIVESIATCIDRLDFRTLEHLYADEVTRDYTSLLGGKAETFSNTALIARWRRQLPGFDRTRHSLSNLTVRVNGEKAVADVDVIAAHWVADLLWTVSGRHNYQLARVAQDWRVVSQTFSLVGESGSREAIARAAVAKFAPRAPNTPTGEP